jgi:4a-hydroxytetrahydrobiopterin dehydratase
MTERINARRFHASEGVEDWRVVGEGACAYFRTGSFAAGVRLAQAVSLLADLGPHQPDVDLRHDGVTVRLFTYEKDFCGLSPRDVELARRISQAAKALDLEADPSVLQTVQVSIDALVRPDVIPFWRALLGYVDRDGPEDLMDPGGRGPAIYFQQMDAPRAQRNRLHVDVYVPYDQAEARVATALAAGGRLVTDAFAPGWWVLADAEGNEACVAVPDWDG